ALVVGGLFALSALSLLLNGSIFWVTIALVRRVRLSSVLATNALATFLAYLPMTLSVAPRVLLHNKRDGVPVLQVGGWFAAVGATMAATLLPLGAVSYLFRAVNAPWAATLVAALAVSITVTYFGARILRTDAALARGRRFLLALRLGFFERLTHTEHFEHFRSGLSMLAHPGALLAASGLRLADVAAQAARFLLAAAAVGAVLP